MANSGNGSAGAGGCNRNNNYGSSTKQQSVIQSPLGIVPLRCYVKSSGGEEDPHSTPNPCPFDCCTKNLEKLYFPPEQYYNVSNTTVKMRFETGPKRSTFFEGRVSSPMRFDELLQTKEWEGNREILRLEREKLQSAGMQLWNTNGGTEVTYRAIVSAPPNTPTTPTPSNSSHHPHPHGTDCQIPVIEMQKKMNVLDQQLQSHLSSFKYVRATKEGVVGGDYVGVQGPIQKCSGSKEGQGHGHSPYSTPTHSGTTITKLPASSFRSRLKSVSKPKSMQQQHAEDREKMRKYWEYQKHLQHNYDRRQSFDNYYRNTYHLSHQHQPQQPQMQHQKHYGNYEAYQWEQEQQRHREHREQEVQQHQQQQQQQHPQMQTGSYYNQEVPPNFSYENHGNWGWDGRGDRAATIAPEIQRMMTDQEKKKVGPISKSSSISEENSNSCKVIRIHGQTPTPSTPLPAPTTTSLADVAPTDLSVRSKPKPTFQPRTQLLERDARCPQSTGTTTRALGDVSGYDHIVLLDKRVMTYMCKKCLETLKSDQDIRNHLFCKMLQNSIQCHVCRNLFTTEEYPTHLRVEHGVRAISN